MKNLGIDLSITEAARAIRTKESTIVKFISEGGINIHNGRIDVNHLKDYLIEIKNKKYLTSLRDYLRRDIEGRKQVYDALEEAVRGI